VYGATPLIGRCGADERNHGLDVVSGGRCRASTTRRSDDQRNGSDFCGRHDRHRRPAVEAATHHRPGTSGVPGGANGPAIVSNQYGQGRALLFAFDLVGTLMTQPGSSGLQGLSRAALSLARPCGSKPGHCGRLHGDPHRLQNLAGA